MTRQIHRLPILALLIAGLIPAAAAADAAAEREKVKQTLKESGAKFLALIENISHEQWTFQAEGVAHSIGEEAEHIALAEQDLQRMITRAVRAGDQPEKAKELAGKEKTIHRLMLQGEAKPENYQSPEKLQSKPEVLEYFGMAHKKALDLVDTPADITVAVYKHPTPRYGELTALQWFYYLAYHNLRHQVEIKAIMKRPDFPKN